MFRIFFFLFQEGTFTGIEAIFQATPWAENCFSPIQQSPTSIEQEGASFPNYAFNNAYFRNEDNIMQTPFETTKEDEFLNLILADESIVINEENKHDFVNSSTQSESLKRVSCESSDTDAEVISKLVKIYQVQIILGRVSPFVSEVALDL